MANTKRIKLCGSCGEPSDPCHQAIPERIQRLKVFLCYDCQKSTNQGLCYYPSSTPCRNDPGSVVSNAHPDVGTVDFLTLLCSKPVSEIDTVDIDSENSLFLDQTTAFAVFSEHLVTFLLPEDIRKEFMDLRSWTNFVVPVTESRTRSAGYMPFSIFLEYEGELHQTRPDRYVISLAIPLYKRKRGNVLPDHIFDVLRFQTESNAVLDLTDCKQTFVAVLTGSLTVFLPDERNTSESLCQNVVCTVSRLQQNCILFLPRASEIFLYASVPTTVFIGRYGSSHQNSLHRPSLKLRFDLHYLNSLPVPVDKALTVYQKYCSEEVKYVKDFQPHLMRFFDEEKQCFLIPYSFTRDRNLSAFNNTKSSLAFKGFKVDVRQTINKEWGLFAVDGIPAAAPIILYTGEIISLEEEARRKRYMRTTITYVASYEGITVDATTFRSSAAYANHSCGVHANAKLQPDIVVVEGKEESLLYIQSKRKILANEEILINYTGKNAGHFFGKNCYCLDHSK